MKAVSHFGIITFNTDSIIMEFANNGDLLQKINENKRRGTSFKEVNIWKIFIQVVNGLRALHELNILHRDLKVFILTYRVQTFSYSKI